MSSVWLILGCLYAVFLSLHVTVICVCYVLYMYSFWATGLPCAIRPLYVLSICFSVLSVTLVYGGQTAWWIKMKLGVEVVLGPGHIVLDGDPAPPKRSTAPHQFLAHVRCGQMAGWIKMPIGTEVGLGPGHIVLDGDRTPLPKKGAQQPPRDVLWPNGWMDQDSTWYGCTRPKQHCVRLGPTSPRRAQPPIFGPCVVAKRSPISTTAEHFIWYRDGEGNTIAEKSSFLSLIRMC